MLLNHEKRETTRIPIEIPIWLNGEQGVSRDISFSGIYFTTGKLLETGDTLHFDFELAFTSPGKPVHLDCQGQVLRVERTADGYGVAATIDDMTFLN